MINISRKWKREKKGKIKNRKRERKNRGSTKWGIISKSGKEGRQGRRRGKGKKREGIVDRRDNDVC